MIDLEQMIINKLASKYGTNCKYYYGMNIPTELKKPCFIVKVVEDGLDKGLNITSWYNATANVIYIQDIYNRTDLLNKRQDLLLLLQNIGVYGEGINCMLVDDSLSGTANYRMFTQTEELIAEMTMTTIDKTIDTKE